MMNTDIQIYELSQGFYFEAAHTLQRNYESEGSLRIHGHTYQAEVTVSGSPNIKSGMLVDLSLLRNEIEIVRSLLDHQFLDEIQDLGPATLENLAKFIYIKLNTKISNLSSVMVQRSVSGDKCILRLK
jgi:6-pyruvoyltetrahydropterin/6-carboxytetrahydropterin synthase